MFTGLVQNQGVMVRRQALKKGMRMWIRLRRAEKRKIGLGESIAVSGVCLTAAELGQGRFAADIIPETLQATTLGFLQPGAIVNLERALRYGDPLGGHFMTGHVDGRGSVQQVTRRGANRLLKIRVPKALKRFLAVKGSIAVDGISLTIQSVQQNTFEVSLVPHTLRMTTLGEATKGSFVNLEVDLIARYLEVASRLGAGLTFGGLKIARLRKQGF